MADSLMGIFSTSSRKEGGLSLASAMLISTSTLVDFGSPERKVKSFGLYIGIIVATDSCPKYTRRLHNYIFVFK